MREYINDVNNSDYAIRVVEALQLGYASTPDSEAAAPKEPPGYLFQLGGVPGETLPAPFWNWFISRFGDNINRTAYALRDIYDALDYIMQVAEYPYTENASDFFNAIKSIWGEEIAEVAERVSKAEEKITSIETNATALTDRVSTAEGNIVTLNGKTVIVSKTADGFCPQLPNEITTTKYLRQDGTWEVPPDTTYAEMSDTTLGLVRLNGDYTFTGVLNVPTPEMPE